ncbi:hypothetical protein SPHINGOT1_120165 [Sphingomonas sp. T1]|nr:hypothetical protein SPHINGOT1_120165 [Sphingomonas sp. T1]
MGHRHSTTLALGGAVFRPIASRTTGGTRRRLGGRRLTDNAAVVRSYATSVGQLQWKRKTAAGRADSPLLRASGARVWMNGADNLRLHQTPPGRFPL